MNDSPPTSPSQSPRPVVSGPATPVGELPAGLNCRDLRSQGYRYAGAVEYWYTWGQPGRMDGDGDGEPCGGAYSAEVIRSYWG